MKHNLRNIAELIGITAVVISLLLVVMELRQTQSAISAAAHSDRTIRNFEILRFAVEQNYHEIKRLQQSDANLTTKQQQVLNVYLQMSLRHFEDLHYQHSIGTISDETWKANREGLLVTLASNEFIHNWNSTRRFYRPSFVAVVEELATKLD